MIGEKDAAGTGLAFAATRATLQIAFEIFELDEVYLEVYTNNERAISIYEAVGFQAVETHPDILFMRITR